MKKLWKMLQGRKRRISELALFGALVIPEPTTKIVLACIGVLLGGADAIAKGTSILKGRKL